MTDIKANIAVQRREAFLRTIGKWQESEATTTSTP